MRERALVTIVEELDVGGYLAVDAGAGALTLTLEDATDFDDRGGQALVGDAELVTYSSVDDELEQLTLAAPLAGAFAAGAHVSLYPSGGRERVAHVWINGDESAGETVIARVPAALYDRLDVGSRDETAREWIWIERDSTGGEWVVADVIGQPPAVSGEFTDPTTLPEPEPSDGVPPAASPTPTVSGGIGLLSVNWPAIVNDDPVTYDVHISTVDVEFVPSEATKHGETAGTVYTIRRLPDGSALTYDDGASPPNPTVYYVKTVARDADGSAPASAAGSGSIVRVTSGDIAAESVVAEHILAGTITGDKLAAVVVLASMFRAGGEAGQRVEFDGAGIRLYDSAGNVVVSIPVEGNPYFKAVVEALGLDVSGNATFRGAANQLAPGSRLKLAGGVSTPTIAPALSASWETITFAGAGANRAGLSWDSTAGTFWGTSDVSAGTVFEVAAAGGAALRSVAMPSGYIPRGAIRSGSWLYVLCRKTAPSPDVWVLRRYSASTLAYSTELDLASEFTSGDQDAPLFWDGARLCRLVYNPTYQSTAFLIRYDTSGFFVDDAMPELDMAALGLSNLQAAWKVGNRLYVVAKPTGGNWGVYAFDYTPITSANNVDPLILDRVPADDFALPGQVYGITHDGARFWTQNRQTNLNKHTDLALAAATVYARYSWYKSTATTAETAGSPHAELPAAAVKRARIRVTTPTLPTVGGVDRARIYLANAAALPGDAGFHRQLTTALVQSDFDAYTTGGGNPPASSSFVPGAPAEIRNDADKVLLRADEVVQPVGVCLPYAGAAAPAGWLLCDGAAVSRTDYAALFDVIGTTYGAGDGSTTFNLPNLKGRVPVGRDAAQTEFDVLGETGGSKTDTLTSATMPSHTHTQDAHDHNVGIRGSATVGSHGHDPSLTTDNTIAGRVSGVTTSSGTNTAAIGTKVAVNNNTGSGGAHNNLPPYQVFNYIIKI